MNKLIKACHYNNHLQNAYNLYRFVEFYILECREEDLVNEEQKWIDKIGYYNKGTAKEGASCGEKNHFYGRKHTEETKRKISLANKGRKPTKEQRARQSEAQRGRKMTASNKKKLIEASRKRRGIPNVKNRGSRDKTVYVFYNEEHGKFVGTKYEIRNKHSLGTGLTYICDGRLKTHKGWKCKGIQG